MINKTYKIMSVMAVILAIFMVIPLVSFADDSATPSPVPFSVTDYGNSGTVASNAPAVTDHGNAGTVASNPTTNPSTGSVGVGTGYGGGSIINTAPCAYLNSYLAIDTNNSDIEVTKLQAFLKNTEGLNVDINGKFDVKTFEGVKAFQIKYAGEVLTPWGITVPTGRVFYTTKKKINEVYCKSIFSLTAEQLAEIQAYKNRTITDVVVSENPSVNATSTDTKPNENDTITDSQVGAVAGNSFFTKVWTFVKWLFGY